MSLDLKNLYFINNGGDKMKRTLLDDVLKSYFSILCTSGVSCEYCKNKVLCDLTENLLNSLKKFY